MEAVADVCQQLFGIAPGAMLLVCLLVFLAGYVDAIAGGGGLISLPAYMIAGLPTHAAIATNKMSSTMAPPSPPGIMRNRATSNGSWRAFAWCLP